MKRRRFLTGSAAATGIGGLHIRASSASPGDRIIVGLMGCGGRGSQLIDFFARRPDVEIRYLCDVDQSRFGRAAAAVEDATGKIPQRITDFRRMLDDPELDVVINATPNHWHGLGTVLACQAGKHVYVEKVASHNIWEGRKMVEAARKYDRVVGVGMQNRSALYAQHAVEWLREGIVGKIHSVHVYQMMLYRGQWQGATGQPPPDGIDFDMYCGPAPLMEYPKSLKSLWLMNRDFSTGYMYLDAVHQLDLARWLIGQRYPTNVHLEGGVFVHKDDRDFPDTQTATYRFGDIVMTLHGSNDCPYHQVDWRGDVPDADVFPDWLMHYARIQIFGTDGQMLIARHGGGVQVYGPDRGLLKEEHGREPTRLHIDNFLECIKTGKRPNADIEEGHLSAALCHLGNISYWTGNRVIRYDGERERIIGDAEASQYLKREYRSPWVIPDEV